MNRQTSIYYYYNRLSDWDRKIYDQILSGLKRMDSEIPCSAHNFDDLTRLREAVIADHPELYWVGTAWRMKQSGLQFSLLPEYTMKRSKMNLFKPQLDKVLSEFDAYCGRCSTDAERLEKAFRYIVEKVAYDKGAPRNQTIISALINHQSVCAGYSKSLQFLLQKYGIECFYVSGMTKRSNGPHAWNIVNLGGNYCHTDVIYGDRSYTDGEMVKYGIPGELEAEYAFLCMTDEEALRDRTVQTVGGINVPVCEHGELSWYWRNGLHFSDAKAAWDHIEKLLRTGQRYWRCQFAQGAAYDHFNKDVADGRFARLAMDTLHLNSVSIRTCRDDDTRYAAGWIE